MLTFAMVMSQTAERSILFTSTFGIFRLLYSRECALPLGGHIMSQGWKLCPTMLLLGARNMLSNELQKQSHVCDFQWKICTPEYFYKN